MFSIGWTSIINRSVGAQVLGRERSRWRSGNVVEEPESFEHRRPQSHRHRQSQLDNRHTYNYSTSYLCYHRKQEKKNKKEVLAFVIF